MATTVADALGGLLLRVEWAMRRPVHRAEPADRLSVLLVDDLPPDPLFGAGYPRAFAIVRALVAAGYSVEHYPLQSAPGDLERMEAAFAGAVRFHHGAGMRGLRRLLWRHGDRFDALFVSRPGPMAALLRTRWRPVRKRVAPLIYDAEAVLAPRERRRRLLYGSTWNDERYQAVLARELRPVFFAQAVTAVGRADADMIQSMQNAPVFVLPHSMESRATPPGSDDRRDLLFVGRLTGSASQSPNVDSVRWFVGEVMPLLDQLLGSGYRLHLAGLVDAPEIEILASERIVFHGVVENLDPLYDRCRLFVAPTRYAAGIPLKVVEAMAKGLPCVVTSLLAAQLGVAADTLAIAGDSEEFARACARLYRDDASWRNVQAGGLAYVDRSASPGSFDRTLAEVISHVADRRMSQLRAPPA